jgi:hypothetical protein
LASFLGFVVACCLVTDLIPFFAPANSHPSSSSSSLLLLFSSTGFINFFFGFADAASFFLGFT